VDRIVQEIDRRSPGRPLTYAQVYAQVYGRLKHHFRVAKYDQVSDDRFEEVKTWLQEEWRRVRGGTLAGTGKPLLEESEKRSLVPGGATDWLAFPRKKLKA